MMNRILSAGLAAIVLTGAATAGTLYECDVANTEKSFGWISPKIAIVLPDDKSVTVVDGITMHFAKGPVAGTLLRNNAKRLIVKWAVTGTKAGSGHSFADFRYRASIAKSTGAVEVSAMPSGFDRGVRGRGTCKTRAK